MYNDDLWIPNQYKRRAIVSAVVTSVSRALLRAFLDSSPDIRKKFENTDFEVQKKVLRDSLFLMLSAAGTTVGYAHVQLEKLAKRHSHNDLGIKPEWYALWLDTLLQTVAEFDPDYSDAIDAAWRDSMKEGIELLAAGY